MAITNFGSREKKKLYLENYYRNQKNINYLNNDLLVTLIFYYRYIIFVQPTVTVLARFLGLSGLISIKMHISSANN